MKNFRGGGSEFFWPEYIPLYSEELTIQISKDSYRECKVIRLQGVQENIRFVSGPSILR